MGNRSVLLGCVGGMAVCLAASGSGACIECDAPFLPQTCEGLLDYLQSTISLRDKCASSDTSCWEYWNNRANLIFEAMEARDCFGE